MMLPRERGTLRETIPKSTFTIVCLFTLICIGTSTFLNEVSMYRNERTQSYGVVLKIGLGALTSIVGIIHTDPLLHARYVGLAVSECYMSHIGIH